MDIALKTHVHEERSPGRRDPVQGSRNGIRVVDADAVESKAAATVAKAGLSDRFRCTAPLQTVPAMPDHPEALVVEDDHRDSRRTGPASRVPGGSS